MKKKEANIVDAIRSQKYKMENIMKVIIVVGDNTS